jgi:hypothetical protein
LTCGRQFPTKKLAHRIFSGGGDFDASGDCPFPAWCRPLHALH